MGNKPSFYYERKIWKKGFRVIAGLDEVGRGAFAGPIVCGCVVFSFQYSQFQIPHSIRIDDSKNLTARQRQIAGKWIRSNALSWGIGVSSVAEINNRGVSKATASGFRRAVGNANTRLKTRIDYLLIDAFYVPYIRGIRIPRKKTIIRYQSTKFTVSDGNQLAIINGDEKTFSIAAASIIAKVYRDKLLVSLGDKSNYKKYLWEKNKGYGTKAHRLVIKKYGITRLHRRKFVSGSLKS